MQHHQDDLTQVQRVLAGNSAAFAILVNRHSDMAYTIAHRIVRNREDAEEIAQDGFIKAYQSLRSFKGDAKFSTWLYRIIYNTAISHTRKKQIPYEEIDERIIGGHTEDEILEDLDAVDAELRAELVGKAIGRLAPDDAALITLFYQDDHSIEDISHITGLSQSNVKVKLFRLRQRLHQQVQSEMDAALGTKIVTL